MSFSWPVVSPMFADAEQQLETNKCDLLSPSVNKRDGEHDQTATHPRSFVSDSWFVWCDLFCLDYSPMEICIARIVCITTLESYSNYARITTWWYFQSRYFGISSELIISSWAHENLASLMHRGSKALPRIKFRISTRALARFAICRAAVVPRGTDLIFFSFNLLFHMRGKILPPGLQVSRKNLDYNCSSD